MVKPVLTDERVGGLDEYLHGHRGRVRPPNHRTYACRGGLDLVTPKTERWRNPGAMIECLNYEVSEQGYRRVDGYERFDGREGGTVAQVPGGAPGSVAYYDGDAYAFVERTDGDLMYKSSSSGWTLVGDYFYKLRFREGRGRTPFPSSFINNRWYHGSNANITFTYADSSQNISEVMSVRKTVVTSGDFNSGDAEGYLVLYSSEDLDIPIGQLTASATDYNPGFDDREDSITVLSMNKIGINGVDPTFKPLRATTHNFGDSTGSPHSEPRKSMYFFGGANIYEWNGASLDRHPTQVITVASITEYAEHLFYSVKNSIFFSAPGDPLNFSVTDGAGEINVGEEITGILSGYLNTLIVTTVNGTYRLSGTSSADFQLTQLSENAGAFPHTLQLMQYPIMYDDRGVRMLTATDAFGDLQSDYVSSHIQPWIDAKRESGARPVESFVVRRKSQYRVVFDDGDILVAYVHKSPFDNSMQVAFSVMRYEPNPNPSAVGGRKYPRQVASVETDEGEERIFMVIHDPRFDDILADRYVYEVDAGGSFNFEVFTSRLLLAYNDFGEPTRDKVWRKLSVEVETEGPGANPLCIQAVFNDGERTTPHAALSLNIRGMNIIEHRIAGIGRNIAPLITCDRSSGSSGYARHTITGITVDFTPARRRT